MTSERETSTGDATPTTSAPAKDAHRARPRFTMSEAAERAGVSRSTIRRRVEAGDFTNATKDDEGVWRIPVEDLLAAGFTLSRPAEVEAETQTPPSERAQVEAEELAELRREVVELRARVEVERAQRQAAEQVAAERSEHLATMRQALRMIEASTTTPRPESAPTEPATPAQTAPPQVTPHAEDAPTESVSASPWWKRMFG